MIDAVVVGAGPAGSVAATCLAREGARVLLVDRAAFPRAKLCGDSLNPGALRLLDRLQLADRVRARGLRIDGMVLTGASGAAVRGRYPTERPGLSICRQDLDARLLDGAAAAGVQVQERVAVRAPLVDNSGSQPVVRGVVIAGRDGRALRVPAPVTIAADGRRSTLAFALGLARHPAKPRRWAVGGYFEGVHSVSSFGEMHVRDGHYFGVAPVPGTLTNGCLVTASARGFHDPSALLISTLRTDPIVGERFTNARLAGDVRVLGPLAVDARAAGVPGLLLAGDAAGTIDPMTGDGLRFAIAGAMLAARAALTMLEYPERPGHEWLANERRRILAGKERVDRLFRATVDSRAAIDFCTRLARIWPSPFQRLIRYAGDVDRAT
jgi:flavin-dependent dehydrogenase